MGKKRKRGLKKVKKEKSPQGTNRHHINPKSRGYGDADNIVHLDIEFHRMWHMLFQNMTIVEIYQFIYLVMQPNQTMDSNTLAKLREKLKDE